MRIVLDTNVVISGTFWTGSSFKVLSLVDKSKVMLIVSLPILQEYDGVLHSEEILDKKNYRKYKIQAIHKILSKAIIVNPKERLNVVKEDPEDNKFIESAIEGKANYIISRDKHLLDIKKFHNVKILTPEEFLNLIENKPI